MLSVSEQGFSLHIGATVPSVVSLTFQNEFRSLCAGHVWTKNAIEIES